MALPVTPTNPEAPIEEIKEFLQALHQYPHGPSVTSRPISFLDRAQKESWKATLKKKNEAEEGAGTPMDVSQYFTYSESSAEILKDGTKNRIAILKRPVATRVGMSGPATSWPIGEWHAIGFAWINTPDTMFGKDLVVFDTDNVRREDVEVSRWRIRNMPIIQGYVEYCRRHSPKKAINDVWYWQGDQFRGTGECLRRTLDWLKELTLMGDEELSTTDWESMGFVKIGS